MSRSSATLVLMLLSMLLMGGTAIHQVSLLAAANERTDRAIAVAQEWQKTAKKWEAVAEQFRAVAERNADNLEKAIETGNLLADERDRLKAQLSRGQR